MPYGVLKHCRVSEVELAIGFRHNLPSLAGNEDFFSKPRASHGRPPVAAALYHDVLVGCPRPSSFRRRWSGVRTAALLAATRRRHAHVDAPLLHCRELTVSLFRGLSNAASSPDRVCKAGAGCRGIAEGTHRVASSAYFRFVKLRGGRKRRGRMGDGAGSGPKTVRPAFPAHAHACAGLGYPAVGKCAAANAFEPPASQSLILRRAQQDIA